MTSSHEALLRATGTILVLLSFATTAAVIGAAFTAPFGYDESYNLQVPLNLVDGHGYATNGSIFGSTYKAFDPYITTGPTLLLPVAAAVWLLGEHWWVFRVVPVLAFLGLLGAWATMGRRVAGRAGAIVATCGVLAVSPAAATWTTSPLAGAGDVMGEVPSTTLVVISVLCLGRPRLAGLLLGLAVMTKLLVLLAVPAVLLGLLITRHRLRESLAPPTIQFVLFLCLPAIAWQVTRFTTLGWSKAGAANDEFAGVVAHAGSGLSAGAETSMWTRLSQQAHFLGLPGVAVLAAGVLLAFWGYRYRNRVGKVANAPPLPGLVLLAAGCSLEVWWLFVADRDYVRHATQATYLVVPSLLVLAVSALSCVPMRIRSVLMVAPASLLAVGMMSHAFSSFVIPKPSLAEQRLVAEEIRRLGADAVLYQGWWQNPELTLLTNLPAQAVESPLGGLLAVPDYAEANDRSEMLSLCTDIVFDAHGYLLCWVEVPAPE